MRPRSPLCSCTCELVPQMTSSTSAVSKPFRSTSAASTVAARCCGCRWARAPLPCLPIPRGVRHASMMKASAISVLRFEVWLILVAEVPLEHLPGRVARQRVEEHDRAGDLETGQLAPAVLDQLVFRAAAPGP